VGDELIQAGLVITAIGMGVVFVLLTALVGIIGAMSALAKALEPAPVAGPQRPATALPARDQDVIPVIAAAIHAWRERHPQAGRETP